MLKKLKFMVCRALMTTRRTDDLEALAISVLGNSYKDVSGR